MPVELKTYPDTQQARTEHAQTQAVRMAGIPSLCIKLLREVRGSKGNKTQGTWPGTLRNILPSLVLDCVTQGSPNSTADLWGQVAAGPSRHDHHQREEALTPMSPQWPQRTSEAHQGSPDRPPASYTAPEASPTGRPLASAAPLVCPQNQRMQDRGFQCESHPPYERKSVL